MVVHSASKQAGAALPLSAGHSSRLYCGKGPPLAGGVMSTSAEVALSAATVMLGALQAGQAGWQVWAGICVGICPAAGAQTALQQGNGRPHPTLPSCAPLRQDKRKSAGPSVHTWEGGPDGAAVARPGHQGRPLAC